LLQLLMLQFPFYFHSISLWNCGFDSVLKIALVFRIVMIIGITDVIGITYCLCSSLPSASPHYPTWFFGCVCSGPSCEGNHLIFFKLHAWHHSHDYLHDWLLLLLQLPVSVVMHLCPFLNDGKKDKVNKNFHVEGPSIQNSHLISSKHSTYQGNNVHYVSQLCQHYLEEQHIQKSC
jgi:hypothetical protein